MSDGNEPARSRLIGFKSDKVLREGLSIAARRDGLTVSAFIRTELVKSLRESGVLLCEASGLAVNPEASQHGAGAPGSQPHVQ